jgi:chromosome segregation ATPase
MLYIIKMPSSTSQSIPRTSLGKLVSLSVDNPVYYTAQQQQQEEERRETSLSPPPPLYPISMKHHPNNNNNVDEQTMLWRNVASLFAKCEQTETDLQYQQDYYNRHTSEMYEELQDTKNELAQFQTEFNDKKMLSAHVVRKLRKYVNKKCESVSYGAFNADNEVFAYIDKIRTEFDARIQKLENENKELREELSQCRTTYDNDYALFIERENDLMDKFTSAIQTTEKLNERVKQHEATLMTQLQKRLNYAEQHQEKIAGDLREEFARAITREIEMESNVSAKLVQSVNDEMTDLITRSNEYHTARYYGLVEEWKNMREVCDTLKKSIGMVDAELSDTKETVDFLKDEVAQSSNDVYDMKEKLAEWKDDIYHEMDRDYYDLKDYVKHRIHRHEKQKHHDSTAVQADANNDTEPCIAAVEQCEQRPSPTEHIIIIDENTVFSDDEEIEHT